MSTYSVKQVVYQLLHEKSLPPRRKGQQRRRHYRSQYITVASGLTFQDAKEIRKRHRNATIVPERLARRVKDA